MILRYRGLGLRRTEACQSMRRSDSCSGKAAGWYELPCAASAWKCYNIKNTDRVSEREWFNVPYNTPRHSKPLTIPGSDSM